MDVPEGVILLWHGSVASIPIGWYLCDGNNSTPDLTDQFVLGAGGAKNPGDTGGTETHAHSFTSAGHTHTYSGAKFLAAGSDAEHVIDSSSDSGVTDVTSSMPPYYALAYIMRGFIH